MKTVEIFITFLLLLSAIFSVMTSPVYASTDESDDEGNGSNGDEDGGEEVGPPEDDEGNGNEDEAAPPEDAVVPVTPEYQDPFAAAPAVTDNQQEIPECDDDEFLNEDNECEKITETTLCPDGITEIENTEDCPPLPGMNVVPQTPQAPLLAAPTTQSSGIGGIQQLPPCDGSFQDCITPEGNICEAGSSAHECEMSVICPDGTEVDSLSSCPNTARIPFPNPANGRTTSIEEFAPDETCLFDVIQPKCTLPEGVPDCPEGFGTNEDRQCFPVNKEGYHECLDGTHSIEDDETGQCYPDSQPCPVNSIMGDNGNCISKHWCEGDNPIAECPGKDKDIEFNPPTTPDLDCGDSGVPKNFKVQAGDPHDFDRDADGIGCEDNELSVGGNSNGNTKVIQKTTVINSASSTASSTAAEVSDCRLDGSSDGILQKFDSVKYQACGLYVDGQKAYSDGFIIGCTQIGNTQLICQAFADSSILNTNIQATQIPAQAATQPVQQGIQPAVNE
jgi:hypothetical protein